MKWVLFFDGDCAFCSASVRRVNRLDQRGRVDFAPLQGELARKLGLETHAAGSGGTMVLLREDDGNLFFRSDALIELGAAVGGIARALALLAILPKAWRDALYQFMADRRHRLRRISGTCAMPDERLRARLRE
ncbi:MAG TPA: DCC1-like thiol-disulfide oxidoreductase family protein [Luteolibacter sp.]|nr:DCC1-like thiol-disulfide oxidoreductase family protein [Luteolibacter sp.]